MKKLIPLIVVVVLAAGGYYWWTRAKAPATEKAAVTTAKVERGPLRMIVSSTGKVVSNLDVDIKCKASGEVIKLPYDVSDPVKKGDLLLQLDPSEEQRAVDQAEATLAASKAKLINAQEGLAVAQQNLATDKQRAEAALKAAQSKADDARTKADRVKELLAKKLSSQEEYDTALTTAVQISADLDQARVKIDELKTQDRALEQLRQQIRIAEAQVQNDQVSLGLFKQRLDDTKVYSPMDGVVTARNVQIGTIISSGISNVGGGTTALTISDLSHIFVLASVDEADIGKVNLGQPVEITVDAFPGKRFAGQVVRMATKGVNISNVVTFEVKIEVSSKEKNLLRPEMTANIDIIAASRDSVLMVPSDAIIRKSGKTYVTLAKTGGAQEDREVQTGINDGQKTELASGMAEGDAVVLYSNADSKFKGENGPRNPLMMGGGRR